VSRGPTIEVRGADRLARTARAAARDLRDLAAANRRVADGIMRAARPPRRTGRLAASLTPSATATEATVSSPLVYAPVIEFGWPGHNIEATHFLADALDARYGPTVAIYADTVDQALAQVKGI